MTTQAGKLLSLGARLTAALLCSLSVLVLSANSIAQIQTYTEAVKQHPDWVQIPGELIRPDCVHQVPDGATVKAGKDGKISGDVTLNGVFVAHYDPCPEKPIVTRSRSQSTKSFPSLQNDGSKGGAIPTSGLDTWVESASMNLSQILGQDDNIDYIAGTWQVPYEPPTNGATIFLFNGIETGDEEWLMQSVLQYGASYAGGGNYWAVANWFVGADGYVFVNTAVAVNIGDYIFGQTKITKISGIDTYWTVSAKDTTNPSVHPSITVETWGLHWTWALAGVLEAWYATSCDQFPPYSVAFSSLVEHGFPSHKQIAPNWQGTVYSTYQGPQCNFMVFPWDEGESILYF